MDLYADFTNSLTKKEFLGHIARDYGIDRLELVNEICLLFPGREAHFVRATDAYLAGTARNVAISLVRKELRFKKRHHAICDSNFVCSSESIDALGEIEKRETVEFCRAAVARLPQRYSDAVVACFFEGQTPREYSKLRNMAFENVRVILRRAKSMLRHDPILVQLFP